jgi:hypothetical protein
LCLIDRERSPTVFSTFTVSPELQNSGIEKILVEADIMPAIGEYIGL